MQFEQVKVAAPLTEIPEVDERVVATMLASLLIMAPVPVSSDAVPPANGTLTVLPPESYTRVLASPEIRTQEAGRLSEPDTVAVTLVVTPVVRFLTNTSARPSVSPVTRLFALEMNATVCPSAEIDGFVDAAVARPPVAVTLTNVIEPV